MIERYIMDIKQTAAWRDSIPFSHSLSELSLSTLYWINKLLLRLSLSTYYLHNYNVVNQIK